MVKVVILGGSYAGAMALTSLYKVHPQAEVTLVSLTTHTYFNIASPRLLVEPEKFDKTVFSLENFVKRRSNGKGKFIQGKAIGVDFENNEVTVQTSEGPINLEYDVLVLGTGSATLWDGFKVNESHLAAKLAILSTAEKLKSAKTVAIIGGGSTGVETAGEIAYAFKNIRVTLYTGSSGPLKEFPRLTAGATSKLAKLGVKIVNNVKTKSVTETEAILESGEIVQSDLVIEAFSLTPYSAYLPDSVKDKYGYVKTDKQLIVQGTTNVIALGDLVSGSSKTIIDLKMAQMAVYSATLKRILKGNKSTREWTPMQNSILVPISPTGGEGMIFGWHVPNFIVRFLKAKTFLLEKAEEDLL